jgi:DNA polymerase-3 subunit alpha
MSSQHSAFIHLHVHSAYSLAEGALKIKDIIDLCLKFNMPAVAVTDTANMFGALEFSVAAVKAGLQPIIGCQFWLEQAQESKNNNASLHEPDQIVLLAQNETGYQNLMKLSSLSYLDQHGTTKPSINLAQLKQYREGIICLTGGHKGPLGRFLKLEQKEKAQECLQSLKEIYQDRLYIEIQRHGLLEQKRIEEDLLDLAYAHDVPIVATNDCFFKDPDMHEAHDALLCIADGTYVFEKNRRRETASHYFKTAEEMEALFSDLPESLENTVKIAKRCSYFLKAIDPILPAFESPSGKKEADELIDQARSGLLWRLEKYVYKKSDSESERLEIQKRYAERLEFELNVINQMGFPGYFLIVADFIGWAKDQGIPVGPGRGSGAGSVVAWALKITDVDPIHFNLLFERFLNPERVSMPDFDIDFCQERRDEVIAYVQKRYGHDRVAQIITFGKMMARAVVRDVGRVLQMPYGQVDRIAKLIPQNPANPVSLTEAIETEAQLREARDADDTVAKLIDIALQLEGLYRHASTHAAGIVIGNRPLDEIVPLYKDPASSMPATQFNLKYVEQAGLVKFDFLGLKTLTVIDEAIKLIRAHEGIEIDPLAIPLDDAQTFKMLAKGECSAVFQLESSGMRDLCVQMKLSKFDEMTALVALYRPGPMDNIPKYLACSQGREEKDFMHPLLQPILEETYSVMIYQEQVMQAAQVLAGYTLGGADLLRRAMGKKIKEEMDAQREIFVKGAVNNNIKSDTASLIFDQIAKFAGYGFNKSHSLAYAFIAYQTAYLKAHYPVEFMAATMTYDMGNTDKLAVFRQEVEKMGITLLPPDINHSLPRFKVEKLKDGRKTIRYALAALKGVGIAAMDAVVKDRTERGAYKDIYDLCRRLDAKVMNKRQMESLAAAGAFDQLVPDRAVMYASVETLLRYASSVQAEKESGQESLFGGNDNGIALKPPPLVNADKWDMLETLSYEVDAIGFYLSAHPLDSYQKQLMRLRVVPSNKINQALLERPSTRMQMAGVVVKKTERTSAKGNRFAFVQLSDSTGLFEITLFSEVLAVSRDLLQVGTPLILTVDVDKKSEEEIRFICQKIEKLADVAAKATEEIIITVTPMVDVGALQKILMASKGKYKITLLTELAHENKTVEILLPITSGVDQQNLKAIRQMTGVVAVQEI